MKKFVSFCLIVYCLMFPIAGALAVCSSPAGDANSNGVLNGIDVTFLVGFFKGGPAPTCTCVPFFPPLPTGCCADANGNGVVNGIDVTYLINFFKGIGPAPTIIGGC
jgi:hypothetical protein